MQTPCQNNRDNILEILKLHYTFNQIIRMYLRLRRHNEDQLLRKWNTNPAHRPDAVEPYSAQGV